MQWMLISEEPPPVSSNIHRYVLCAFKGQFGWVYFTAISNGIHTKSPGFADPTHWCFIEDPKKFI